MSIFWEGDIRGAGHDICDTCLPREKERISPFQVFINSEGKSFPKTVHNERERSEAMTQKSSHVGNKREGLQSMTRNDD